MTNAPKTFRTAAVAAIALMLAAPLVATPAIADSDMQTKQQQIVLDETTTGSIGAQTNCDPTAPDATLICRVTRGDPNAKFPSAPAISFGF